MSGVDRLVNSNGATLPTVRAGVTGGNAELTRERREAIVVIERPVLLAVDDDVLEWRRPGLGGGPSSQRRARRESRSDDAGRAECTRTLQEGSPADAPVHGKSRPGCLSIACRSRSHIASEVARSTSSAGHLTNLPVSLVSGYRPLDEPCGSRCPCGSGCS